MTSPLPRVYPIADTGTLARFGMAPEAFAAALAEGGATLIQFRHKGHFSRNVFETLKRVCALGIPVMVNDRADLALMFGAGVHVGQDDLPPLLARGIVGEKIVGFSTHNAEQLAAGDREPVDYLAIGPVFTTGSKENPDPVVGVDALPELRKLTDKPLVAIGGITRATAQRVWAAGVDSIAVIGDLLPEVATHRAVRERMEEWLNLSKA